MLTAIRHYLAARRFDRQPRGEQAAIDKLLAKPPVLERPSPELRSRIMQGLRESTQAEQRASRLHPGWIGLAAACVVVGAVSWFTRPPVPTPGPAQNGAGIVAILPTTAVPVIRMVANSMDRPILNEAQKMMDDTKRATNAVVRRVPFARRGG